MTAAGRSRKINWSLLLSTSSCVALQYMVDFSSEGRESTKEPERAMEGGLVVIAISRTPLRDSADGIAAMAGG